PERVHRVPEALVDEGRELSLAGEPLHGIALPDGLVAANVLDDLWRQDEEPAVDPAAVAVRLLVEAAHPLLLHREGAEASRRLDRGHGREHALVPVERDQ